MPCQPWPTACADGLLHQRRGVDEDLQVVPVGVPDEAAQRLELALHHLVVVAALGIDRDRRALAVLQHLERIARRRVVDGQRHDRLGVPPQALRIGALLGALAEPAHVALPAGLEEFAQPLQALVARLGRQVGRRKAYRIEAQSQRLVADRVAQRGGGRGRGGRLGPAAAAHRPLSSAAIGRDAGIGQPQALGRLAGLPEHVDRHAAARIPVAADAQPARRQHLRPGACRSRACRPRESRPGCGSCRDRASATCSRPAWRAARSRSRDGRSRAGRSRGRAW